MSVCLSVCVFFLFTDENNARIHSRDISHEHNNTYHTHTENDQLLWHLPFRNVKIMQTNFSVPKLYWLKKNEQQTNRQIAERKNNSNKKK